MSLRKIIEHSENNTYFENEAGPGVFESSIQQTCVDSQ